MSHLVQQAFGRDVNLYDDVLKVAKDCSPAQLRKAYYKQALIYHPDKNSSEDAKLKFQAISWAYEYLKDAERRKMYDEDGSLPQEDEDTDGEGSQQWKDYFDAIFGQVSVNKINEFALKYKMSDEEEADVLKHYEKFRGDLMKMLEYVMLSKERDVLRWMEDYIKPAIEAGRVKDYTAKSTKILDQIQKRLEKEKNKPEKEEQEDPDRTDTEDSEDARPFRSSKKVASKKKKQAKNVPHKAKPTNSKKASDEDLIAAIRKRGASGGNPFASLGARYGVSMDDEDPLGDEEFARIQSTLKKKNKK